MWPATGCSWTVRRRGRRPSRRASRSPASPAEARTRSGSRPTTSPATLPAARRSRRRRCLRHDPADGLDHRPSRRRNRREHGLGNRERGRQRPGLRRPVPPRRRQPRRRGHDQPLRRLLGHAPVANGAHTLTAVARDPSGNITTSANVGVTVTNTAQPPGLVAAYSFDQGSGTAAPDASGTGNNGTLTNGPTWAAPASTAARSPSTASTTWSRSPTAPRSTSPPA